MNNELRYALVAAATLPDLAGFVTKQPRVLSDGRAIVKWRGECPVNPEAAGFEQNRFQTGVLYWFIEKRRWYTYSETLQIVATEPRQDLL